MKLSIHPLIPAAVLFCALPLCALPLRAQDTGTAHPEQLNDSITAPPAARYTPVKPSPAIPMNQPQTAYPNGQVQEYNAQQYRPAQDDASAYHPYQGSASGSQGNASGSQGNAASGVIHQPVSSLPLNEQLADQPSSSYDRNADPTLARRPNGPDGYYRDDHAHIPANRLAVTDDPTSGVVMEVPTRDNEIPQSTLLRTWLTTSISTRTSKPGEHFIATLSGDVARKNRVLLPSGSTIQGHITAARSGHGVSNASVIRLQADSITLPDGTTYPMLAEVVDVANVNGVHVTSEGAIKDNAMTRGQATMLGSTTGGGAIAGALVGAGVGAVVGAAVGAGVGTVLYLRRDREQTLPAHSMLIFALDTPLELTLAPRSY